MQSVHLYSLGAVLIVPRQGDAELVHAPVFFKFLFDASILAMMAFQNGPMRPQSCAWTALDSRGRDPGDMFYRIMWWGIWTVEKS